MCRVPASAYAKLFQDLKFGAPRKSVSGSFAQELQALVKNLRQTVWTQLQSCEVAVCEDIREAPSNGE